MSHLSKMRLLDSSLPRKFLDLKFGKFVSLIHTKSLKTQISQKKNEEIRMMRKAQGEDIDLISIFTNITEIIGTKNIIAENKDSSTEDAHVRDSKLRDEELLGTQGVCRKVEPSKQLGCEEKSILEVNDVSPIVHKITEIIRTENAAISIEERLENSGFLFNNSEIVEKVLKRCFKVGHCALRFFNWMKFQTGYCHTTGTYNTMISIAGEAKEFGLMEKLVEQMEIESCPKDIKTWTILISSYGKAKLIGKALLVFEKMRKSGCEPDEIAYKLIVHALCNVGKAEIAMEFYKEMVYKNMGVDMNLYKLLLNCLSRAGDLSAARSVGDDMINVSQIPEQNVYSCILRCYCISGRITEAIELLQELKGKKITLDPANFEILVKGLCRTGRIGDALEIIEIMKQNHVLNGEVYGIVINGYLRKNDIHKAFELFSTMKESGYAPTASTYTELMQHLFRLNEYEKACNLYNEMLENGVEPDIVAITALVAGHVQNNNFLEALNVFRSMKEKGIRATPKSYWVFIRELCKVSRPKEAIRLLNEMQNSKMNIRGEIFHSVISCLEIKGEVECIRTVEQMWRASKLYIQETELAGPPMDHQFPHAHSKTVVDTCEPTKLNQEELKPKKLQLLSKSYSECDLQEICRILSSSMDWKSMQVALGQSTILFTPELVLDVLSSCQKHGHASLSFFSWVGQRAGYNHTTETFNMAIKIAGSAKDFKHMRNLFLEMKRRCCLVTSDTWTVIIMQYGRVGLTEISLKKFEEMKKDGVNPNRSTYKYLLMSLCGKKGCKVDEAIKIFEEMICVGIVPDKELAELYLNCLCEWDKLLEARRCMKQLCIGGFSVPLSYSLVVRALCRAGKLDAALALVDEIGAERSTLDQYIYGSLIHGLLRGGRLEETLDKMEEMKHKGINPTVHVYTSLIVHYSKEKQFEKALDIFKKMKEEGCEPTIVTYSALIRGYMNVEMVSEAWNLFRRMKLKGPYPDFETYSMFITCLCKTNRSEEALQLIHEMLSVGIFPSTVNFRSVFHGLNREGKEHLAHTVFEKKWALMAKRKFLS